MADETNKTATEATQKPAAQKQEAPKQVKKAGIATYNKDEAKEIMVRAADGTQLYNPVTRTLYTDDKKGVEALDNDQFVQTNLDRGKLKKVS
jgi:hypothetical protein